MSTHSQILLNSHKYIIVAVVLLALSTCTKVHGPCNGFWVSTTGSDSASGDVNNPFLTLEHARDVIRNHPAKGICTINVNIKVGV